MRPSKIIWKDTLCCEPILRSTPFGMMLLVECGGKVEPDPGNKMYSFLKSPSGSWQGPFAVWPEEDGAQCLTEVVVAGEWVYGFFSRHDGMMRRFRTVIRKTKDGIHWQNADEFAIDGRNLLFRGAARAENGDILIPYQRYIVTPEDEEKMIADGKKLYQGPVRCAENGSMIFREGQLICRSQFPAVTTFPMENGRAFGWVEAAALWQGSENWLQLIRMDGTGVLYQSVTTDNGVHWSSPVPTDIPNPGNKPRLCPLPDGEVILFHTPNAQRRNPFEAWYSADGLKTFYKKERISSDDRLYHYADTCIQRNTIYLTIERDRKEVLLYRFKVPCPAKKPD